MVLLQKVGLEDEICGLVLTIQGDSGAVNGVGNCAGRRGGIAPVAGVVFFNLDFSAKLTPIGRKIIAWECVYAFRVVSAGQYE